MRLSKNLDADGSESRALVRWMAGDRTDLAGPPAPPAPPRLVVPGHWSEIAAGKWADEEAYRVLVRVAHGT